MRTDESGVQYELHENITREDCQDKCMKATDVNCQSINYQKSNSNCFLVQSTIQKAKEEFIYRSPFSGYDVMVCEEEGKY